MSHGLPAVYWRTTQYTARLWCSGLLSLRWKTQHMPVCRRTANKLYMYTWCTRPFDPLLSISGTLGLVIAMAYAGADPVFWFGRGTGRRYGVRKSPSGVQGQSPGGGLSVKPPEARRLRHEAEKNMYGEKNKSIQTDIVWQYHNYHHLIHSSFYVSSHFVLKYKTRSVGSRASEMVHNGSRASQSESFERNITVMSINW